VLGPTTPASPGLLSITVRYHDRDLLPADDFLGSIRENIQYPNGARLFAIKSDTPFDKINIGVADNVGRTFGITNIRYLTDKAIYDKHKND
jgi:hypothetical protein